MPNAPQRDSFATPKAYRLWFVALLPPSDLQQQITQIKQDFRDRYHSQAALRSPPHITLYPPFPWPEASIAGVKTVVQTFAQSRSTFPIQLNGFGTFPPRVIYINVLPTPALIQLHRDLQHELARALNLRDPRESQRPYRPHLTVAFRDLSRPHFHQAWSHYQDHPFQAKFTATHLTLLAHNQHHWRVDQAFPFQSAEPTRELS